MAVLMAAQTPRGPGWVRGTWSAAALGARVIAPFWEEVEQDLMTRLDGVSVEDLCREAEARSIESEGRRSFDFVI